MDKDALEIAAHYVDQILNGEILPPVMLQYMKEIEDGYYTPISLFEKAKVTEAEGYLALGVDRTDLYMHIVHEVIAHTGQRDYLETAEVAYARANSGPRETLTYSDIARLHESHDDHDNATSKRATKSHISLLSAAEAALLGAIENFMNENNVLLAEVAFEKAVGEKIALTTDNIGYATYKIDKLLTDAHHAYEQNGTNSTINDDHSPI